MNKTIRKIILILLSVSLYLFLFAGCSDMPSKEDVERILSASEPILIESLKSSYGLNEGDYTLSEGKVAYSRMAKYTFTVEGEKHEAVVVIYKDVCSLPEFEDDIEVFTDYYSKDFRSEVQKRIEESVKASDVFSGCDYDIDVLHYGDIKPKENSVRANDTTDLLPDWVNPDNMLDYLDGNETPSVFLNLEMSYYGSTDMVSDDKINEFKQDLSWAKDRIRIKHYGSKETKKEYGILDEVFISDDFAISHCNYAHHEVIEGVELRFGMYDEDDNSAGQMEQFDQSFENGILYIKQESNNHCKLIFKDQSKIPDNGKIYEIYYDSKGKKKQSEKNVHEGMVYNIYGEYEIHIGGN